MTRVGEIVSVLARPDGGLERVVVPDHLVEHLFTDTGHRVTRADLDVFQLSETQAFVRGRRRRQRHVNTTTVSHHPAVQAIRLFANDDGDAASWLTHLRDIISPFPVHGCLAMVPSRDQLMVLPLVDITSVGWLDVLVSAGQSAHNAAARPLSSRLLWVRSSGIASFHSEISLDETALHAPDGFTDAVNRLAQRALRTVDAVA